MTKQQLAQHIKVLQSNPEHRGLSETFKAQILQDTQEYGGLKTFGRNWTVQEVGSGFEVVPVGGTVNDGLLDIDDGQIQGVSADAIMGAAPGIFTDE